MVREVPDKTAFLVGDMSLGFLNGECKLSVVSVACSKSFLLPTDSFMRLGLSEGFLEFIS